MQIMSFRDHGVQQRDVSALNRLKLAAKPQQKLQRMCLGEIGRRYLN